MPITLHNSPFWELIVLIFLYGMVLFLTQCLVPFSLFSGLRCWELAFEGSSAVHLGVDNLNVVRHVARILDGGVGNKPFELCVGGDCLLSLILLS